MEMLSNEIKTNSIRCWRKPGGLPGLEADQNEIDFVSVAVIYWRTLLLQVPEQ